MSKWKMVRLGDVCEKGSSNIAQNTLKHNNGTYPIYGASGFIKNVDFYKQDAEYIAIIKDGAGVGRVMILPAKSSVIGTLQYIFPKTNISINFLYYALKFMNLGKYFTGATIPHIYFKDYKNRNIPLPPLEEQKKIADELDTITGLIAKRTIQISKLDLLVKAKFVEMFGDPVANPMGWEKRELSKTTKIITGNTPPRINKANYGNYIEWIKTDNITSDTCLTRANEYLSEIGVQKGRVVEVNAILMACIAGSIKSIGRVAITDRRVAFNQQINAIIPIEYNVMFLYWLFKSTQDYLQSTINMSLKGILSKGKLESLVFVLPPLPLQNKFADYVTKVEDAKAKMQNGLKQLEVLYKERMQEYFE